LIWCFIRRPSFPTTKTLLFFFKQTIFSSFFFKIIIALYLNERNQKFHVSSPTTKEPKEKYVSSLKQLFGRK
jgi:hypothetical protein